VKKIKIIMNRYHKKSLISVKEAEGVLNRKSSDSSTTITRTPCRPSTQGKILEAIVPDAEVTKNIKRLAAAFSMPKKNKG